jgi:hypothetical protein
VLAERELADAIFDAAFGNGAAGTAAGGTLRFASAMVEAMKHVSILVSEKQQRVSNQHNSLTTWF